VSESDRRLQQRMQEELAEVNEPRNRYQKQLDDWWESQRDFEEELADVYYVGGFQEHWSQTPSFTKGRRDRDWRVK
jgi:hypothetical protein